MLTVAANINDVEELVLSQDSDQDYKLEFAEGKQYEYVL